MKTTKASSNLVLDKSSVKQLVIPFVASMLIVVVIFAGIIPGIMAINAGNKKLTELKTVSSSLSYKADTLENLDVNSLAEKVDLSVSAIPLAVPYQNSLAMLSALLVDGNLAVNDLSVKKSIGQAAGKSLDLEMDIEGDYQSVKDLLTNFQKSLPLIAVRSIELTRGVNIVEGETESYLADILLTMFFNEPPKTIGKASDQLPAISADFEKALRNLQSFTFYKFSPGTLSTSSEPVEHLFP